MTEATSSLLLLQSRFFRLVTANEGEKKCDCGAGFGDGGCGRKKVKRCLMDGRIKRSGVEGKMRCGVSVECGV